jgi:ABC-type amino acid transport substrate-binding protein
MKKVLLWILAVVVILALVFGSSFFFAQKFAQKSGITTANKDALDLALERGVLYVSTELGNVPWTYADPKTGEITGFTIDLVKMYTDELGIKLEVKTFDWAGVIPSLTTGKVDMITAPLSRTVPRSAKILYTEPYVIDPGVAYAKKGRFKSLDEISKEGVVITTTTGSIHETMAKKLFPKATINPLPTVADTVSAIESGRADVNLTSMDVALGIIKGNPSLEIVPGITFMDSFACATRFDSPKLWQSFNLFMRLIKLDGSYAALYKKWFGTDWKPTPVETSP